MSLADLSRRHVLIAGAAFAAGAGAALAQGGRVQVIIENLDFTPAEIEVEAGTVIEWVNKDPMDHSATVDGKWDVLIPAGKSATHEVTAEDTVTYYCRFHPNMTARITVKPGS